MSSCSDVSDILTALGFAGGQIGAADHHCPAGTWRRTHLLGASLPYGLPSGGGAAESSAEGTWVTQPASLVPGEALERADRR